MGYVEHVLQPGEVLVHKSKLHWFIYLPVLPFLAILLLGLALYWGMQGSSADQGASALPLILTAVGAVGTIVTWLRAWIRRTTTELAVTDRRVIFKRGLIRRHTVEMNMDKVESVDVDQSILGRIFNYGDVTVRGTGASIEPLRMIGDPLHFRSRVTAR
ncbi:MAG TPA: PH domain-containing protein [Stellaceae bacterium]|nr:PH domain-containing protein [Stellaceae bacterium]